MLTFLTLLLLTAINDYQRLSTAVVKGISFYNNKLHYLYSIIPLYHHQNALQFVDSR
jgi:hypothetical protein